MININKYSPNAQNCVILSELSRAGIPAYQCDFIAPFGNTDTVIGILHFQGKPGQEGQQAVFIRKHCHYCVKLNIPMPAKHANGLNRYWKAAITVDGWSEGKHPDPQGVRLYHVHSEKALKRLVCAIKSTFGQVMDGPLDRAGMNRLQIDWLLVNTLRPVPATQRYSDLVETNLDSLLQIAGQMGSTESSIFWFEEARYAARKTFGIGSDQEQQVSILLCRAYARVARNLKDIERKMDLNLTERIENAADRERILSKHARLLRELGSDGESVKNVEDELEKVRNDLCRLYPLRNIPPIH